MIPTLILAVALALELPVAIGGPAENPAYLPVYAASALGAFEAEGVRPMLRRTKHPTAAITALRDGEAVVAVTTTEQAVRGAWARGKPVRILVAHTRVPAVTLLVSAKHRDRISRVEDLRGQRVGIPGPGTTGHLVLASLLDARGVGPWQLDLVSVGGAALASRLAAGDLVAAVVEEPWTTRALAARAGEVLLDLRRHDDTVRHLGHPFYEVVSVAPADDPERHREPALTAFARALIRVQAWLAATPPEAIADRLPAEVVGDRTRFVTRLTTLHGAHPPTGEATEEGLVATLRVLRAGSPWPVTLKVTPRDLREPPFVTTARARLGSPPPPP